MLNFSNPIYASIEFTYQPSSYFFPISARKFLLSTIKGTERRREIARLFETGNEKEIQDWMAHSALEDSIRNYVGSINPRFMGGEYLPDLDEGEVEIARFELDSTTGDVANILARRRGKRIYYRLTDEYHDKCAFKTSPLWSTSPLTLGRLILMIETATDKDYQESSFGLRFLDQCYRDFDYPLDTCRSFLTITSQFYPQLNTYYQLSIEDWYANAKAEFEEESGVEGWSMPK